MQPIKVCFIVFSQTSKSVGGHYRSLYTHFTAFRGNAVAKDSFIVNFGKVASPVLNDLAAFRFFRTTNPFFIFNIVRHIKKEKPGILHCYDKTSLILAKIVSMFYTVKIIYTKCGGENSKHYVEVPTIFFSSENHTDFLKKGGKATSFLIPNRAVRATVNADPEALKAKLGLSKDNINFLRINRLSPAYQFTMEQSVLLIKKLRQNGIPAKLYIVGGIEKQEVYDRFANIDENVLLITDEEYTRKASDVIPAFDFIIATGRGVMEAFSYDKVVLGPCSNSQIPVAIDEGNFADILFYNFSQRTMIPDLDEEQAFSKIVAIINSKEDNTSYSSLIFEKYFDVQSVIPVYGQLYHDLSNGEINQARQIIVPRNYYYYFITKTIKSW